MGRKLVSFFTARCPICRFRSGARVTRTHNRILQLLRIYLFECHACNRRFRALRLI